LQINPHIFREFSIRGIANRDLTDDVVIGIGQAIGSWFRLRGEQTVLVGHDVRLSSERISEALIRGLLDAGLSLTDIGLVPTPVLNFSTDSLGADGGIMITASHNPPDYNGFKIRAKRTLQGDEIQQIAQLVGSDQYISGESGSVKQFDPLPDYLSQLKRHAIPIKTPLPVVVDGGNGANGKLVCSLLSDLGFSVHELFCEPNGSFPNRSPDPTASGATEALTATVLDHNAIMGIAYDGDGDRLVVVDDRGQTIYGDQLLMLLARDLLRIGPAHVVYEILCTQALADDISAHGGIPIMTPSGYAFIHESMRETGASLGGELSGHLFFNEPHFHFDDAILATIKLLNIVTSDERTLSAMVAMLPSYASSPELRLRCPDEAKTAIVDRIREHYKGKHHVDELDGARIHFPSGWALVRQSNTQPVISMRFEAHSGAQLGAIQDEVQSLVESAIAEISDS
jgi:phosphomannomutase/phosphoglucomutase